MTDTGTIIREALDAVESIEVQLVCLREELGTIWPWYRRSAAHRLDKLDERTARLRARLEKAG